MLALLSAPRGRVSAARVAARAQELDEAEAFGIKTVTGKVVVKVGGKKYTVKLKKGKAVVKLAKFAKADQSNGLLGRGLVRFDLRIPGKMIVRLPRAPGEPILPEASAQTVEG